ncbi:MAG: hypothetical protein HC879_11380 [Leptolyngbyaceae cyanobacterium SL_5_9]|nr:hypothetical protein [Leptolyngbyaceae cyanobacterium SL_5_9]
MLNFYCVIVITLRCCCDRTQPTELAKELRLGIALGRCIGTLKWAIALP